ncbi:MAG: hypothetical protein C0197_02825 [Caldimicrobium thiodismutans]|uniref:HEPN domain-containing protein n=1 Tax=Caldimicrobium thiodismutans TaxID=1653476 RepID=A0A2N7PJZ3_9BACT|nr:MAG: hypothetical protein C0197_02825 [Caldimicrobium thiodismutans]
MTYFIRARTHYHYAQLLFQEILKGKRELSLSLFRDIFLQGLKAIYAITEVNAPSSPPTLEDILKKILPTLSSEEKEKILQLKELLFSKKDVKFSKEEWLSKIEEFLDLVRECLQPIL